MSEGFIFLHRKILQWEWYQDSQMVHLFLYLLLSANHEDNQWRGIEVKRGQHITGLPKLKTNTGISIQSLRTCLTRLKSTGEITIKTTNKYRIITMIKYNDYQQSKERPTDKLADRSTFNQHSINIQSTANNKDNKDNKENNKIILDRGEEKKSPTKEMREFLEDKTKQQEIINILVSKGLPEDIVVREISKFSNYWTELTKDGRRQRWELQPTFELKRRLTTWFSNVSTFNSFNKNLILTDPSV